MPSAGFETAIPANQAAADLSLRPQGHWDRLGGHIPISLLIPIYVAISQLLSTRESVLCRTESGLLRHRIA
jgi:hypothetical protein